MATRPCPSPASTATAPSTPAFGTGGVATVNVAVGGKTAEVARAVAVQADGKVVIAGPVEHDPAAAGDAAKDTDIAVARFDDKGKLDTAFGDQGVARIDFGTGKAVSDTSLRGRHLLGPRRAGSGERVVRVRLHPEPTLPTAPTPTTCSPALTSAGALDTSLRHRRGADRRHQPAAGTAPATSWSQADGKIVATGYSRDGDGVVSPVLITSTAAGALDTTFGTGGVANRPVLPGVAEAYNVVQRQGDAYILAGYGRGADANEKVDLIVYRFTAAGAWDQTFGAPAA